MALPACRLESASQSFRLYVSPFCFWELLTHLEDVHARKGERFREIKGTLMKFRYVEVLDDPIAEVYRLVFRSSDNVHGKVNDGDLIYAALAALEHSESSSEFYGRFIEDQSHQTFKIAGCVSRARERLQIDEQKFQAFLREIVDRVRAGQVRLTDASDYERGVQDLCLGWWFQIRDSADDNPTVFERFVRKTYIYYAYLLHLARVYAARTTDKIDQNDFEDVTLCLHLGLTDVAAVMTTDHGLRDCLRETLGTLNSMADVTRHTPLQVWEMATFG